MWTIRETMLKNKSVLHGQAQNFSAHPCRYITFCIESRSRTTEESLKWQGRTAPCFSKRSILQAPPMKKNFPYHFRLYSFLFLANYRPS